MRCCQLWGHKGYEIRNQPKKVYQALYEICIISSLNSEPGQKLIADSISHND
jgi:hypothetical protein